MDNLLFERLSAKLNVKFYNYNCDYRITAFPEPYLPLKFLTIEEFKSLQLEKEVTFNDFHQDNLSKLKNKNLKVYFVLKGGFHALTNWNRAKTINEKDASDFLSGSKELAGFKFADDQTIALGKELRSKDIPKLGLGHVSISIVQDVSELISNLMEIYIEGGLDRYCEGKDKFGVFDNGCWEENVEEVMEEMGVTCYIEDGGFEDGVYGVKTIGYILGNIDGSIIGYTNKETSLLAVTTSEAIGDHDWHGIAYFS